MSYTAHQPGKTIVTLDVSGIPGFHTTDPNTILHWKLDGNGTDDGSLGIDVTRGGAVDAPYTLLDLNTRILNSATINSASINATAAKTAGAITIAGWFWFEDSTPGANTALIGVRGPGSSGNPDAYNFPWELGITTGGFVRAFHQYDNKQDITALAASSVTEKVWVHLAASRSADGLTWKVYQNGLEIATASGTAGDEWDGGTLQNTVRIGHNASGSEIIGYVASAIVKTITLDAGSAIALYQDAQR